MKVSLSHQVPMGYCHAEKDMLAATNYYENSKLLSKVLPWNRFSLHHFFNDFVSPWITTSTFCYVIVCSGIAALRKATFLLSRMPSSFEFGQHGL